MHRIKLFAVDKRNRAACFGYNNRTGCDVPWLQVFGGVAINDTSGHITQCHGRRSKRTMSVRREDEANMGIWIVMIWWYYDMVLFTQQCRMTTCKIVLCFYHESVRLLALSFLDRTRHSSTVWKRRDSLIRTIQFSCTSLVKTIPLSLSSNRFVFHSNGHLVPYAQCTIHFGLDSMLRQSRSLCSHKMPRWCRISVFYARNSSCRQLDRWSMLHRL